MKTPKALLSLALTGCLLLSACGGDGSSSTGGGTNGTNTNSEGDTGRYLESVVTPPLGEESYSPSLVQQEDGSLVCYNDDLTKKFESTDGGLTWTESEGPGASITGVAMYDSVMPLAGGDLLASVITEEAMENGTYESSLLLIKADGSTEGLGANDGFAFEGIDGNGYYSAMIPLPGGRVFISHTSFGDMGAATTVENEDEPAPEDGEGDTPEENETPEEAEGEEDEAGTETNYEVSEYKVTNAIFDAATGAKLKDIPVNQDSGVATAATDGQKLYLVDYGSNVTAYDLDGNATDYSMLLPSSGDLMDVGVLTFDKDGSLVYANSDGIYKEVDGEMQSLLVGAGYTFGDPNTMLDSIYALGGDAFLLRLYTEEGYGFYHYAWDPDATMNPDNIINVWALRDSNTLRAAVGKFREKYPDGMVNLEIGLTGDDSLRADDAIRTLNTEILNGSGPDVILLDGTPLESYIDKGVLADLNGLVDTGTYYNNLLEQVKSEDGSTYFIPVRVTFPVLAANEGYEAKTIDEFIEMMKQSPAASTSAETSLDYRPAEERSLIAFQNLDQLWEMMWPANAPAVINGTDLNTENLHAFLQNVNEIAEYNGYGELPADGYTLGGMMSFSAGGTAASIIEGSLMAHLVGSTNASMFIAEDVMVLNYLRDQTSVMVGGLDEDHKSTNTDFTLLPGLETGVWTPKLLAGINAGSQKQEVAADFISLLLSDGIQSGRYADGFAVTENGMQGQIDNLKRAFEFDSGNMELADFNTLFNSLTTLNLVDEEVGARIYENALPYLQGKASLDDAVNSVEQDLKNYLAERQ